MAIENVTKNAIEAMGGQGVLEIEVRREANERELLVCVRDTGMGVPDDVLDAVIRGGRAGTTKAGGSGIGLAAVAHVCRVHDARFDLRRRKDCDGTEAVFSFPEWSPAEAEEIVPEDEAGAYDVDPPGSAGA